MWISVIIQSVRRKKAEILSSVIFIIGGKDPRYYFWVLIPWPFAEFGFGPIINFSLCLVRTWLVLKLSTIPVFYIKIFRKVWFTCILLQAVLLESQKRILAKMCLRCHFKLHLDVNSLFFFFLNCLFLPRAFSYIACNSEVHSHATQTKSHTDFSARQLNQG